MDKSEQSVSVMAPYAGYRQSRSARFMHRAFVPMLIFFGLLYGILFSLYGAFLLGAFVVPLALLALIAIWALPDMDRAPTRTVEHLFLAFLVVLVLWPNYLAIAIPGLPWITLLRIVGAPMMILFLVCISCSAEFRAKLSDILKGGPLVWKMLVAFAAIQLLTIPLSSHVGFSIQRFVNAQINWTGIFFISCYVFAKRGRPTLWATLLCLSFVVIYPIVIKEHHDSRLPWADHIPFFLKVQDESVQRTLAGAFREGGDYRVQGPFTTPLGLGEYAALMLPFMLHFVVMPYRMIFRVAAAAAVPLIFQIVLLSDSRLGLIGCMLSFLTYILLYALFGWRSKKNSVVFPAIVLSYPVLAVAAFAATLFIGRVREKVYGSGQYQESNEGRATMYAEGIPKVLKAPWGHGPGTGAEVLGFHNPGGVLTIDTYYLAIALEYGVIGFILYYGMLAGATVIAGRKALSIAGERSEEMLVIPVAVALTNFIIIKSVFSNDEGHPLAFMLMGMAVALSARQTAAATTDTRGTPAPTPAPRGSRPLRVV